VTFARVDDDNIQCFRGAYFAGVTFLPYHAEMHRNRERSLAYRWIQDGIVKALGLPEYDGRRLADRASPPPSLSAQNSYRGGGAPRLLIAQRRKRTIANVSWIAETGRHLGFNVLLTYFEGMPFAAQYALVRYADVFLSIHGMALQWAFAMDGTTPASRGCRTVIELRHFVKPFPLRLQFYRIVTSSANLSYVEIPAKSAVMGESVERPAQELRRLMRERVPFELKGFHDQTASYENELVSNALAEAYKKALSCPA